MDNFNNNYNYNNGMGGYYNQPFYNAGYAPTPMIYQGGPMPQNKSSLTAEEIAILNNSNPGKFDLAISREDNIRAMCNHKKDGMDMVQQITDGSGDVYCPICQERWNPISASKEEVVDLINNIVSLMQNAKWVGDYGVELIRDYFPMIPLLKKFPDLYTAAMNQFNKYCNVNGYANANDAAIYSQYNNIMGYVPTPSYNQPYMYNGGQVNPYPNNMGTPNGQMNGGYPNTNMYGNPYAQPNPYPNNMGMPNANMYGAPTPTPASMSNPMQANNVPNMPTANYAPAGAAQPQAQPSSTVTNNGDGTATSTTAVL